MANTKHFVHAHTVLYPSHVVAGYSALMRVDCGSLCSGTLACESSMGRRSHKTQIRDVAST